MMKGGTGPSVKPTLDARGSGLELKVAEVEAAMVYRVNHAQGTLEQLGSATHTQGNMLSKEKSSDSEAALALDAAYSQRLTEFMADVKFKATDHVHYPIAYVISIFSTIHITLPDNTAAANIHTNISTSLPPTYSLTSTGIAAQCAIAAATSCAQLYKETGQYVSCRTGETAAAACLFA
jgi:hypothetical protein